MGAFSLYGLIDPCAHTGYDLVDSVLGNVSAGFFNSCNELLFIARLLCVYVCFNYTPYIFHWIQIRALCWPISCPTWHMTVEPSLYYLSFMFWVIVLLKDPINGICMCT